MFFASQIYLNVRKSFENFHNFFFILYSFKIDCCNALKHVVKIGQIHKRRVLNCVLKLFCRLLLQVTNFWNVPNPD